MENDNVYKRIVEGLVRETQVSEHLTRMISTDLDVALSLLKRTRFAIEDGKSKVHAILPAAEGGVLGVKYSAVSGGRYLTLGLAPSDQEIRKLLQNGHPDTANDANDGIIRF